MNQKDIEKAARYMLNEKKRGAKCMVCGAPIRAAGSAIIGTKMCFTCITGEADDSEDYEVTD